MSDLRKAAEMALHSLNMQTPLDKREFELRNAAIEALRQALAQPEQEPVTGMFEEKLPDQNPPPWVRDYKAEEKT